jgi:micrococcal nuclease
MIRKAIAALALALLAGGDAAPGGGGTSRCGATTGVITRVIDGDTVELEDGRKIRYLGVDTPETQGVTTPDCYGPEAKAFNVMLVTGQPVRFEYDEECEDHFNRTLAYVFLGDRMVNEVLLERGLAKKLIISPNKKYEEQLTEVERQAEAARAGLWGACP